MSNIKKAAKLGVQLIWDERTEQIVKHGYTGGHDVEVNSNGQLSKAASVLAAHDWGCCDIDDMIEDHCPEGWNRQYWEKILRSPYEKRLIVAGALIAAELDRLQNTGVKIEP